MYVSLLQRTKIPNKEKIKIKYKKLCCKTVYNLILRAQSQWFTSQSCLFIDLLFFCPTVISSSNIAKVFLLHSVSYWHSSLYILLGFFCLFCITDHQPRSTLGHECVKTYSDTFSSQTKTSLPCKIWKTIELICNFLAFYF